MTTAQNSVEYLFRQVSGVAPARAKNFSLAALDSPLTGARKLVSTCGAHAMFTIGEFSRITGLTVKALRFYQEEGLLLPTLVDDQTGYRYYDGSKVERARTIVFLKELD